MEKNNKNRQNLAPLFALGFVTAACGGGGGSSSSGSNGGGNGNGNGNGNNPQPFVMPDEVPLALYENHPTNKAVHDVTPQGQSAAQIDLPADTADNNLFRLDKTDGRIWFKTSPDYEAETDSNSDGVYIIRLTHSHNDRGYTQIEVTVQDVEREFTAQQWIANEPEDRNDYFEFTYQQVRDILPDNDFVKYIIDGFAYAMPQTGPLVLTWSLILPDSITSLEPSRGADSQVDIDRFRANLERAFNEFEKASNVKFVEVKDTTNSVGDIRFYFHAENQESAGSVDNGGFFFLSQPARRLSLLRLCA